MSLETGAPPPPDHLPVNVRPVQVVDGHDVGPARPARGLDATTVIPGLAGPPPGTVTYRVRATETAETDD